MRSTGLILLAILFFVGCEEKAEQYKPMEMFNQLNPNEKIAVVHHHLQQTGELEKYKQEIQAAHKLDYIGAGCFVIIGLGVALMILGLKKIGLAVSGGGIAAFGSLLYWGLAQQLAMKYAKATYIIGVCIIAILVAAAIYALFVKDKGWAVVREGSLLDKIQKKVRGLV